MIVAGLVKILLISLMVLGVVLTGRHLEIGYPSKFTINISLLTAKRGPGRHTSSSYCIFLVGVESFLRLVCDELLLSRRLVEILLKI